MEALELRAASRQFNEGWITFHRRGPTNHKVLTLGLASHIPIKHVQSLKSSRTLIAALCSDTPYFQATALRFSGEGWPSPRTKAVASVVGMSNSAATISQVLSRAASARPLLLNAGTVFSKGCPIS